MPVEYVGRIGAEVAFAGAQTLDTKGGNFGDVAYGREGAHVETVDERHCTGFVKVSVACASGRSVLNLKCKNWYRSSLWDPRSLSWLCV